MDVKMLEHIDGSTAALIPARGGSKSVPKKNIRPVRGHPMIAYSIAAARLSERIGRVIVSTDSEEIAGVARAYGAETPFLRPPQYAQDNSPDIDFVKHSIEWLYEHEGRIPAYFVHLRPTTPVRSPKLIDSAIAMIQNDSEATSLRSGHICASPPYKWFKEGAGGYLLPLMPGITCDEANLPRQDFPTVYIPNGYVDILKTEFIIQSGILHGDRMIGFQTEEVPDIDTETDIKKLELFPESHMAFQLLYDELEKWSKTHAKLC